MLAQGVGVPTDTVQKPQEQQGCPRHCSVRLLPRPPQAPTCCSRPEQRVQALHDRPYHPLRGLPGAGFGGPQVSLKGLREGRPRAARLSPRAEARTRQ